MNLLGGEEKKDGENQEEVDEVEEEAGGANVADMKDGEYILHVLIETGKDIMLPGGTKYGYSNCK